MKKAVLSVDYRQNATIQDNKHLNKVVIFNDLLLP